MSKKSGFFYAMFALLGGIFASQAVHQGSPSKYQPTARTGGGGGGIRSYGKKRVWPSVPRDDNKRVKHAGMVQAYARVGIIWHNNKLYWKDRYYAEANKGVRTDMIISN